MISEETSSQDQPSVASIASFQADQIKDFPEQGVPKGITTKTLLLLSSIPST